MNGLGHSGSLGDRIEERFAAVTLGVCALVGRLVLTGSLVKRYCVICGLFAICSDKIIGVAWGAMTERSDVGDLGRGSEALPIFHVAFAQGACGKYVWRQRGLEPLCRFLCGFL